MTVWLISFAAAAVALAAGIYYLACRVHACPLVAAFSRRTRVGGWVVSFAVILLAAAVSVLVCAEKRRGFICRACSHS